MSLYPQSVALMSKMLGNMASWLDQAEAYAQERAFDPNVFVQARLYPDQFALVRQVQSACDNAKFVAARLAGQAPPTHEDNETTMAELKERVAGVLSYLEGFSEADPAGAETRHIELPFIPEHFLLGADYLHEFGLPNFFFHLTHAYAILRHNGVPLGKRTFVHNLTTHPKG